MFLSVVIPTYNRLPILEKCLRALEQQQLEAPISAYEVVVVDDGSTDDSVAAARAVGARQRAAAGAAVPTAIAITEIRAIQLMACVDFGALKYRQANNKCMNGY